MKKFFLKFFLLVLPFLSPFIILGIIDPFNVFHYKAVRDNGIEPNKHYIKMRYIVDNPGKFDSFLFGSSRVGFINVTAMPGLRCYNMSYSQGISKEHFDNLKTMIQNNIIPHTVLIGIDDIACYVKPEDHSEVLYRLPPPRNSLAKVWFLKNYLKPSLLSSIPDIMSHKGNDAVFRKQFYENGGFSKNDEQAMTKHEYDWENAEVFSPPFSYGIDNVIADLQSIISLCNRHGIKLIIFTNPIYKLTYQEAVENGYIDFLTRLSEITDYYNFSGLNNITTNNDNYIETSHFRLKVGDLIIDTIFNNKTDNELLSQGFGYFVTNESKAELFHILQEQQMDQNINRLAAGLFD